MGVSVTGQPLHVDVHAGLGGWGEAETGVELVGGGVGDGDREADGAGGLGLELAEELGADAAALGGGEEADIDQTGFRFGVVEPPAADGLAVFLDNCVARFGVGGFIAGVFGQVLHLN